MNFRKESSAHAIACRISAGLLLFWLAGCGAGSGRSSPSLQSIAVTPAGKTIAPGSSQPFTATGKFSEGTNRDITASATWSESHASVAVVNGSGGVTAIADGTTDVTAASSNVTDGVA
jgi:ABC-type phosphate transport system substrate-binding protein